MKRTSGILSIILALAMVVGALVCVTASATETGTAPYIEGANVVYGDEIRIAFTIEGTDDGDYGIAVVTGDEVSGYEIAYATFEEQNSGDVVYYLSHGIAAKDIDTEYQFAVVEKTDDGVEIVGDILSYSVEMYVDARIKGGGLTTAQENLYEKLLAYGKAADAVLDKSE